jgi:ribose/xylose/arabinose/galactoside ABC-type transport system permease subunit
MSPRIKSFTIFFVSVATHLAIFSYFVTPNFLGVSWLNDFLPRAPATVSATVVLTGLIYGALWRRNRWASYLSGVAFAALFLCFFALSLSFAMANPYGPKPGGETFQEHVKGGLTDPLHVAFLVGLVVVPVALAAIGCTLGAAVRRLWHKFVSEPLQKRQTTAG